MTKRAQTSSFYLKKNWKVLCFNFPFKVLISMINDLKKLILIRKKVTKDLCV